jgi:hypothetical protein
MNDDTQAPELEHVDHLDFLEGAQHMMENINDTPGLADRLRTVFRPLWEGAYKYAVKSAIDAEADRDAYRVALSAALGNDPDARDAQYVQPDVYSDVRSERRRAHEKHGPAGVSCQQLLWDDPRWLAVLTEEVGEVARAVLDYEPREKMRAELVQVAAMACAWADALRRSMGEEVGEKGYDSVLADKVYAAADAPPSALFSTNKLIDMIIADDSLIPRWKTASEAGRISIEQHLGRIARGLA